MKFRRSSRGAGTWVQNILGGLISSALFALLVNAYDWLAREHIGWYARGETWQHALGAFLAGGGWYAPSLLSALCAAFFTGCYIGDESPASDLALLARRSLALLASLFVIGLTTAFMARTFVNWIAERPLLADPGGGWVMLLTIFVGMGVTEAVDWWPRGGRAGDSGSEDGNELRETRPRS